MVKKKSNIRDINELREVVLLTLEGLRDGEVSVMEAGAVAKLSETVISGGKSQMEYARLTRTECIIPFFGKKGATLGNPTLKRLEVDEDDDYEGDE